MAKLGALVFYHAFPFLFVTMIFLCKATSEDREVSIVYLGSLPEGLYSPSSHHRSILQRVVNGRSLEKILVRSYKRSFNGFAAKLTEQEREKLANMKEVISVFPSRTYQLQTTRSWDFMDFHEKINRNGTVESDVVVGVLDDGIWPESDSFRDEDFGPPPKKWKGACEGGKNFTCNNKLIGARYYGAESARDEGGHGTFVASTAAGKAVKDASFYGIAQGTARGGVPAARIAAYKICTPTCKAHNMLAAFDDAIADGVDIITISIGPNYLPSFYEDPIAIGAFHAMEKGILTSNSAGNDGPSYASVTSAAPWVLTVAASSIDRRVIDKVVLGNGQIVVGHSVNTITLNGTSFPLIHGKDASRNCTEEIAAICYTDCLDSDLVKGKIVICGRDDEDFGAMDEAYRAGALGSVLFSTDDEDDLTLMFPLAAATLHNKEFAVIKSYMNSTRDPQGTILKSEDIKDRVAPVVAYFSSRGPNKIFPDIIKPDISAPGVQILAASLPGIKYTIMSGTSVACPHAAGAAAYVKSFHPDWSAAAIKSSLMTTAWPMNDTYISAELGYGSGHINPVKAIDPGLVYEASKEDYIRLLCTIYDQGKVRLVTGDNSTCPSGSGEGSPKDHNYPTMGTQLEPLVPFKVEIHRRVKNVGLANSIYTAKILSESKVEFKVVPEVLSFKSLNEEKTFNVTVAGKGLPYGSVESAALVWFDGTHSVRSPIAVYTQPLDETRLG